MFSFMRNSFPTPSSVISTTPADGETSDEGSTDSCIILSKAIQHYQQRLIPKVTGKLMYIEYDPHSVIFCALTKAQFACHIHAITKYSHVVDIKPFLVRKIL